MGFFDFLKDIDIGGLTTKLKDRIVESAPVVAIKTGVSQINARLDLRNRGLSFSNETFSNFWNRAKEESIGFEHITEIGINDPIRLEALPKSNLLTNDFGAVVSYDVFDEDGKFINSKTVRVDLGELTTPLEILNSAREHLIRNYPISQKELDTIQLVGAMRR